MMTNDDDSEVMTPVQVAEWLSIPKNTLYAWRSRGKGPKASKVGRHLRYRRSEVERWLDEQAKAS